MSCPTGTGFDVQTQTCNHVAYVKRCKTGRSARILVGFDDLAPRSVSRHITTIEQLQQRLSDINGKADSQQINAVDSLLEPVFARQTFDDLGVADSIYKTASSHAAAPIARETFYATAAAATFWFLIALY